MTLNWLLWIGFVALLLAWGIERSRKWQLHRERMRLIREIGPRGSLFTALCNCGKVFLRQPVRHDDPAVDFETMCPHCGQWWRVQTPAEMDPDRLPHLDFEEVVME